jgi:hypothetical protein
LEPSLSSFAHPFEAPVRVCALLAALTAYAAPARAQTEAQREQARQLAAQGFDALQRKDYRAAEGFFRSADQLVHAPTLIVDHARALVGLGKLVEGHEEFELVLREGVAADAPRQWKKALAVASAELAALEPRLAWLTIKVTGPKRVNILLDGKPVPEAMRGVRRATNPGARSISVHADRFLPADQTVTLVEGQTETVELTLKPDPNAPALVDSGPAPEVIVVAAPVVAEPPDRTLATVLLSAGGVGLAAGAVTGFLALRMHTDLEKSCPGGTCTPRTNTEYADDRKRLDRYRGLGTASGVAFAMGAGCALGGAALFLFTGHRPVETSPARSDSSGGNSAAIAIGAGFVQVSGDF